MRSRPWPMGSAGSSLPATHGADVTRGLEDGLNQIATMIRDANK